LILIRFDTVPERRRAAGAAREEEVEEVEGTISRHCGAVKGESREGVNRCFNKQLRISIHHPYLPIPSPPSTIYYEVT
jgi:hypothetical protein